jgi:UDP-N-acetylmuramoylalanine--D-glutamate ligase
MPVTVRGTVGVLGYGVDGQSVVEALRRLPEVARIAVFDDRVPGMEKRRSLEGIDVLFRSPGFPLMHPLLREAQERSLPMTSSTQYFLEHYRGRTIGVTGSNGKTTCSALIAAILRAQYGDEHIEEGGNDRKPRLDLLLLTPPPLFVVLELSSFQLCDLTVSPSVAVVLNITPNHLDWHASMEEYIEAKRNIVRFQGGKEGRMAVLKREDPIVCTFVEKLPGVAVHWFDHCPLPPLRYHFKTHPDTLSAAVTTARALGVSEAHIVEVLERFPGVPQRLEFVRESEGVQYYNDSSSTTPESAITACEAFPVGRVVLLLGGRDKGMDFTHLYRVIEERKVRVVPYGEMAEEFRRHLSPQSHIPHPKGGDFEATVARAREVAKPGDVVVLSPACASFDLFRNAKERGKIFTEIVQSLRCSTV